MVITRTPLRISIAGGGTDLSSWYQTHGSMYISAAIDKYIYTTSHVSPYGASIRLRYSRMEEVKTINEIEHEIIRETLRLNLAKPNIEITSHAEIPAGTGLGSSGSFGVGLLQALNPKLSKEKLAEEATRIQIEILKYPIGKQDQYVAAYGGCQMYEIDHDGQVAVTPFLSEETLKRLEQNLVLFYTGYKHDSNQVLSNSTQKDLDKIQELAWQAKECLGSGDLDSYGRLLNQHWQYKKNRGRLTNPDIDKYYEMGLENGALGGKLIGAGGGGFLLFYTLNLQHLIDVMPLLHQPFHWDLEGSKVIYA